MGVDAKSIQVCLFRIVRFSFSISSKFVIKHPLISTVLFLLLVFYFFLPRAFFLLICSSPFLSCTYVFIRFYWYSQSKNDGKAAKKSDARPPRLVRKDGKSVRRTYTRSSSSRNVEVKTREAVSDGRSSNFFDDDPIIGRALRSAAEKLDSSIAAAGEKIGEMNSNRAVRSDCSSKVETEISTSEDEEAKENRNKAVEWNADDQKNLMDLGLLELERNKRLESLIARRRARKLYKAQTDKNLMSSINNSNHFLVSPVSIARCHTFDVSYSPDLGIPGSAPSVLLQRNPFDIPYDPFEEKPNLMADSFQQEFMAAQQREMMFCRHESFTLGSFCPFPTTHNKHDIAGHSGFKRHQDEGNSDRGVQSRQFEGGGTLCNSSSATGVVIPENAGNLNQQNSQPEEIEGAGSTRIENTETRTITNKENICESSSSSFLENDEQAARAKKATNLTHLTTPPFIFNESPTPSSGPCPLPKGRPANEISYLASPATIDRSTLENHLLYTNSGPWHTPNDSIASDMQVEVSEVGSPPLTGDESDGDSLTYDGDVEKEITSGSDEMWRASPRGSRLDDNDRTSMEVNEFSEENISRGFLGHHHKEPEDSVIQLPQQHQTDHNISNELQDSVEGIDLLDSSVSFTSPQEDQIQNVQESVKFSEKSADEVNIDYNLDVPVSSYEDLEDEKSVDVKRDQPEKSITSDFDHTISKPAGEIISESITPSESKPLSSKQSVEEFSFAYSTDVPAPKCDDLEDLNLEDLKSVEAGVPEASLQQVTHNLLEPADQINSERINHIEGNSLNSSNNAIILEVSISETTDAPVQKYDDFGGQKSVKVASDLPETSIISEIAQDLSVLANDINSGCSNPIESESPNTQDQAIEENRIADTIDAPVTPYDDKREQKSAEFEIFGTTQNFNDPSTAGIQQGSMVEQDSSDPKSASHKMVEVPQTSSDLNPHKQTGVSEYTVRDKLFDKQLPENLCPTPAQNEQHEISASADHPSTECNYLEISDTLDKTIDEGREMLHINEAVHDDEKTKEDPKAAGHMHDEAEKPIGGEATVDLSNLTNEVESRSAEHIESTSGNLIEYDSTIQQTKPPEEDSECKKVTQHTNAASPTKHEPHVGMPSTIDEEALLHISTTINNTVANEISSNNQIKLISETESQGIYESSYTTEIPKSMEDQDNSPESIKDAKPESRNLTEYADQFGGRNSSNGLNDDEHIKNESKDLTENGNTVDKETNTDEVKALTSEAP